MQLNKENMKRIRGLIVFTSFVLVALWNYKIILKGISFCGYVILPFVLGGTIAFILNVPMHFIEDKVFGKIGKRRLARVFSFLLTLLFMFAILSLILFVVVPELGNTIINLGRNVQAVISQLQEWADMKYGGSSDMIDWISDLEFDWNILRERAENMIGSTYAVAKSVISGVATFFIAFVFSCYILLQKEKLNVQVRKVMYAFLPRDWTEIFIALSGMGYKAFSHFLTGQCLEALILGGLFFVTMLLLRLPYALLISIIIAFTAMVPLFGAFAGCAIGALLIFTIHPLKAMIFIVIFIILQQVEGNFIYPHVVGNSVGLPSIWVLVAVGLGARLMGIVGMLIFIPLSAVVYSIFRGIVHRRLKERGIEVE